MTQVLTPAERAAAVAAPADAALPFLPFALPSIGMDEVNDVSEALLSGWLTTGPRTKEFERTFAEFVGARHAIAVNSATASSS